MINPSPSNGGSGLANYGKKFLIKYRNKPLLVNGLFAIYCGRKHY